DAMQYGYLAGFPLVNIKATLLDGAYHEVDSSEMAFKLAGSMALKEAVAKAKPVLLEPMMAVEIITPEEYMGEVIGDVTSRRGSVSAMEDRSGAKVVKARVPLSPMFGYVGDLRSKTQGRANSSMIFDSYAEVPQNVAEEIIAERTGKEFPRRAGSLVPLARRPAWRICTFKAAWVAIHTGGTARNLGKDRPRTCVRV